MGNVHPSVVLGPGVIISGEVVIEEDCEIGAYSVITGKTHIGPGNLFGPHTVVGADPQDKKFKGGGLLTIGRNNRFREFVTVHRGHLTREGTIIGDDNYFLVSAHVGHDCRVGSGCFIANGVLLAGHVEIGNKVNISGMTGFHQFCRVGDHAMISGLSGVRRDIYPWSLVQGDPAAHLGVNRVGMERDGWSREDIFKVREAFRLLRAKKEDSASGNDHLRKLLDFRSASKRGMAAFGRGAKEEA